MKVFCLNFCYVENLKDCRRRKTYYFRNYLKYNETDREKEKKKNSQLCTSSCGAKKSPIFTFEITFTFRVLRAFNSLLSVKLFGCFYNRAKYIVGGKVFQTLQNCSFVPIISINVKKNIEKLTLNN